MWLEQWFTVSQQGKVDKKLDWKCSKLVVCPTTSSPVESPLDARRMCSVGVFAEPLWGWVAPVKKSPHISGSFCPSKGTECLGLWRKQPLRQGFACLGGVQGDRKPRKGKRGTDTRGEGGPKDVKVSESSLHSTVSIPPGVPRPCDSPYMSPLAWAKGHPGSSYSSTFWVHL